MTEQAPPTVEANGPRWQFSLRSVLLAMAVAAVLSAIYRVGPQLDALVLGSAPAILCVYRAARSRRHRRRLSPSAIAAILPSLALLYVVSVGPAILFRSRFAWIGPIGERFYAPLEWLYQNTPLSEPLSWYVEFWQGLAL